MTKLKLIKKYKKNFKYKFIYTLRISYLKKTTKINFLINLGNYISNINIYIFLYPKIIFYSKLGSNISKKFSLISLYYLKNLLINNNIY